MVILEDGLFERDEEFVVVLSVPMGETGVEVRQEMATITIEDNDGNSSCMCSYHSKVHPFFQIQLLIKHVACVLQYLVYFGVGSLSLSLFLLFVVVSFGFQLLSYTVSEGNASVAIVVTKSGESEAQVDILFCTRDEEAIGTYGSVYYISAASLIPRLLKRSLGTRLSATTVHCDRTLHNSFTFH